MWVIGIVVITGVTAGWWAHRRAQKLSATPLTTDTTVWIVQPLFLTGFGMLIFLFASGGRGRREFFREEFILAASSMLWPGVLVLYLWLIVQMTRSPEWPDAQSKGTTKASTQRMGKYMIYGVVALVVVTALVCYPLSGRVPAVPR